MSQTKVRCKRNLLINLGNFQNTSIEIEIEDYVREGESTAKAVDRIDSLVVNKLSKKVEEVRKDFGL
jgi:hypothetical protein